jgi:hypothetical protein
MRRYIEAVLLKRVVEKEQERANEAPKTPPEQQKTACDNSIKGH